MCQILSRRRVFNKGELVSDEGQKGHCELKSYRVHSRTGQTTGVAPDQGEQCHFTTNKSLNGTQGAPGSGGHLPLGYRTTQVFLKCVVGCAVIHRAVHSTPPLRGPRVRRPQVWQYT